jgi:hypothetical protein
VKAVNSLNAVLYLNNEPESAGKIQTIEALCCTFAEFRGVIDAANVPAGR